MVWLVQTNVDVYWLCGKYGVELFPAARATVTSKGPANQGGVLYAGSSRPFYLPSVNGELYQYVAFQTTGDTGHIVVQRGVERGV